MEENNRPVEEKSESENKKRHAPTTPHHHQQQQPSKMHSSFPSTSVPPSMAINIKMKEDRPESASFTTLESSCNRGRNRFAKIFAKLKRGKSVTK